MIARVEAARRPTLPVGIWALGLVSLFMDVSSEMIHALLPVYLVTLGTSALAIGVIEGIGEATASVVKIFSGALSDWFGRRKLLLVLGYGLGALSKPLFPLATSASLVLGARFVDRVGKGVRGAPRDALVGDLAPPGMRGAAFGLRRLQPRGGRGAPARERPGWGPVAVVRPGLDLPGWCRAHDGRSHRCGDASPA